MCLLEQTVCQESHKLQLSISASYWEWDAESRFDNSAATQQWLKGGFVKDQCDVRDATTPSSNLVSTFVYLVAGLGIGAAVSILLAPKSGAETRQWIANKCLDGVDTANKKVRHTRRQVKDMMDQGQEKISEAVEAGREAIGKS